MDGHGWKRGTWNSKIEYFLACLGYMNAIGSFLRFPMLCVNYGGVAFLVPYFFAFLICGIPLLYMEMAVGQLTRLGPLHSIAKLCPLLKGIGLAMVISSFINSCVWIVFVTWALHYFFYSFASPLPWATCDNWWNSDRCTPSFRRNDTAPPNYSMYDTNVSYMGGETFLPPTMPSREFFYNFVLNTREATDGLFNVSNLGSINFRLTGFLVVASLFCFIGICMGVKSIGKMTFFMVLPPYVIVVVLLVRGLTLPGSTDGIVFFLYPKWSALSEYEAWRVAFSDNIYTFGTGIGIMITYSSYSNKRNNVLLNTLGFAFISVLFKIVAVILTSSFFGALSHIIDVAGNELALMGAPAAFVMIPYLLSSLPVSNFWSAIFFFMIACFGITRQFANLEVVCTAIVDELFSKLENVRLWQRPVVSLVICVLCFLLSLPYMTQGGLPFLNFIDSHNSYAALGVIVYFEVMAVAWFYGSNRLARLIDYVSGYRTYYFIPLVWLFLLAPLVTYLSYSFSVAYLSSLVDMTGNPEWVRAIGYLVVLCSIIWVPVGVFHELASHPGSFKQCFIKSITPTFSPAGVKQPNRQNEIPMTAVEPRSEHQPVVITDPLLVEGGITSEQPGAESASPPPNYEVATEKNSE